MAQSNKTIRIWGTNEPSNRTSVSKNITIQHWEFFEDDPFSLIEQGYRVINSDDAFLYIVMKFSGSYPQALNQTRIWEGANVNIGGTWDPHIFDGNNASNNPALSNPLLRGAIAPTWNDNGPAASTYLEAFYATKLGIPAIVANAWSPDTLTQMEFNASIPILMATAPGQNLARQIPHRGHVVVDYDLGAPGDFVQDQSGNGFDARQVGIRLTTPLDSFGPPYTFRILAANASSGTTMPVRLTGSDDTFELDAEAGTVAFVSSNITYILPDFNLPRSWNEVVVNATEDGTTVSVDGEIAGEFRVAIDGTTVTVPMAFVAPVREIDGQLGRFTLWDEVLDIKDVTIVA